MHSTSQFSEIMFEFEPIGIADSMAALSEPIEIQIESEGEAESGDTVYFGLPATSEEIMEVKAIVKQVEHREKQVLLTLDIREVDKKFAAVVHKILSSGQANSEKQEPVWAMGVKQTNNTYAMLVNSPAGVLTTAQLAKLAELANLGTGFVKLTHAQRMILFVPLDKNEEVRAELARVDLKVGVLHKGVRNVRACCGSLCKHAQNVNAIVTALEIDKALYGRSAKFDIKIAVSDCSRNCSESYCCDIGLIGEKGAYKVLIGGRGSQIPFRAIQVVKGVSPQKIPGLIRKILDWYEKYANENERLWKVLVRLGAAEVEKLDFSQITLVTNEFSDGIDETTRFHEQLARMAAVKKMKTDIDFASYEQAV